MSSGSREHEDGVRVLVVDDDPAVVDLAREYLEFTDSRFTVETETSVDDALDVLQDGHFDCVVSDYAMPTMNGFEFIEAVRASCSDVPFVVFTSQSQRLFEEQLPEEVADLIPKEGSGGNYDELVAEISRLAYTEAT
jgi:CheY-like chemotaxis protein